MHDSNRGIYLDANATTPPLQTVIQTWAQSSQLAFGNPGSAHAIGINARHELDAARIKIAELLDAESKEVVFTSGGTEAINLALLGRSMNTSQDAGQNRTIALQLGEHPASAMSAKFLEGLDWKVKWLRVLPDGQISFDELRSLKLSQGDMVTFLLAHNETGVIQDTSDIARTARRLREQGVWTHVDAVQAIGKIPVSFQELDVDSLSIASHKFYGPRGIGALLIRDLTAIHPIQFGGGQEHGLRPGTESAPLASAMAHALDTVLKEPSRLRSIEQLRDEMESQIQDVAVRLGITCQIHGQDSKRLPNTIFVSFEEAPADELVRQLAQKGVYCSSGSACKSGTSVGSEILRAMHGAEGIHSSGGLRLSLPLFDFDQSKLNSAVECLERVLSRKS